MCDDVWAIVSSYCPGSSLVDTVASVQDQVGGVIVVDDGSGVDADTILSALAAGGADVVRLPSNGGIAAALNVGIDRARLHDARAVLTLDQDSHVPARMVSALRDVMEDRGRRVGAVVPEYFAEVRQAIGAADSSGVSIARGAIQSGMLIPLDVVDAVGPLRADFFIDLVDTEYELRLRRGGYEVLAVAGQRLGHALGAKYRRQFAGMTVRLPGIPPYITLSTPFRYFYRVRNRLVLNAEYWRVFPRQILRDSIIDAVHFVNALWVARPRRALWRIYRAALYAAATSRMGRMPAALQPIASEVRWGAPPLPNGAVE